MSFLYLQIVKTLCKDQDEIRPYKEALRTIFDLNTKLFENLATYLSPDDRDEDNNTQIELSDTDRQYGHSPTPLRPPFRRS